MPFTSVARLLWKGGGGGGGGAREAKVDQAIEMYLLIAW